MQLQFQNGVCLNGRERFFRITLRSAAFGVDVNFLAAEICDQIFTGVTTIGAAANDRNHVIQMIERIEIAF